MSLNDVWADDMDDVEYAKQMADANERRMRQQLGALGEIVDVRVCVSVWARGALVRLADAQNWSPTAACMLTTLSIVFCAAQCSGTGGSGTRRRESTAGRL